MSPPHDNSASAQSDPPRETTGGLRSRLRWLIPKTLGTRLALTYSGLALLIMAILGGSLIGTIREFYEGRLHVELLEETIVAGEVLAPLIEEGAAPEELNEATKRLADALEVRVTLIGRDGMVLAESHRDPETMENHADRPEVQRALLTGTGSSVRASETISAPFFYVARSIANGEAVVRIGMPLSVIDGLVQQIQRQVLFAAITAGVLMTGAGLFVARRISAALGEMRRQASAVAAGDLDTLVEPAPTQELGDLGRAFNAMTVTLRGTLEELSRVRTRLEATLADLSDGVVIIDEHGHVVLANGAALEMLGASGNVLGMPFVEVARDHELVDLVARAGTTSDPLAEQIIQHSRSGKTLQAAARRLATHDERIGVIVLRDITELRRLEGVRRDFVANVSHELRTPLTSIRALVETLEAGAIHDPEVSADFLGRIVSEVERLTLMVDELLDLARLESGRVTLHVARVEPASLIEHVVQRLASHTERAGLTVRTDVDAGTPMVLCDRERIDQVLLNLVHNAVKFTPSGGTIDITARRRGESVEFQVRDTGIGVMPDEMPRLFERFYKTDRARRTVGTGLGLAIAKHIVQVHGGTIWAEPNVPAGTTFIFRLPIDGPQETGTVEIEPHSLATSL